MSESRSPRPDEQPSDEQPSEGSPPVVVAVTRTGGFAGLTKAWTAEPREDEASVWSELISRCPWDEPARTDPHSADRFQWNIRAQCGPDEDRRADLPDRALTGPWRELVDAVLTWNAGRSRA
jgi:hypothetical protein